MITDSPHIFRTDWNLEFDYSFDKIKNEIENNLDKTKDFQFKPTFDEYFKKDKVLVCTTQGYDEFYILPRGPLGATEDEVLTIKEGAKSNQIAKAFAKASGAKTVNRQLLNKFIGMVA